jgi:16S rRNA C967 or C1407 C5-methylase (RsmB/RsmF family)
MSTNETDILIDNLSEDVFPFLTELNNTNEMDDSALQTALAEEFDLSGYIADKLLDAWKDNRNRRLAKALKEPHPAHKHRIKTLQTFIKEIL